MRTGRLSRWPSLLGSPAILGVGAVGLVILVSAALTYTTWGPRPPMAPSSDPSAAQWGPLAVSRISLGGDDALITGVMRISEACVALEGEGGTSVLPVWSLDQIRWDPNSRRIMFTRWDGQVVGLGDGQAVSLGGSTGVLSTAGTSEGGSAVGWLSSIDWAAEPDPGCPADSYWGVGDVLLE